MSAITNRAIGAALIYPLLIINVWLTPVVMKNRRTATGSLWNEASIGLGRIY